jgi:hypothetical protein
MIGNLWGEEAALVESLLLEKRDAEELPRDAVEDVWEMVPLKPSPSAPQILNLRPKRMRRKVGSKP